MNKLITIAALTAGVITTEPTLMDKVKDCLDTTGSMKREYLVKHYIYRSQKTTAYNSMYDCNGKVVVEQYPILPLSQISENSISTMIALRPLFIGVDDAWYVDPKMNGINGDERKYGK